MNPTRTCPQCGAILPSDALEGLCPKCMSKVVFGPDEVKPDQPEAKQEKPKESDEPEGDLEQQRAGTIIGRYKLLEQIGEGGFGVVYMAEQIEPVQRKVALKVVKAGMDTKEVIARFEAERQALALMDHTNIAKVLDGGTTETGRPYFVMELVKGIPITEFCDRKQLSPGERLRLFLQVCAAVQHAHQKGIIHRDLKPTNILVTLHDGKPVPKVIDFGVAKALGQKLTEKTLFTSFAQMIGTPAYMSPEQAELSGLDVDTRSDIYSLGVLLYELLTGVTPFDAETLRNAVLDEVRRMIRETQPPKPSTRLQTLGEKLTTVAKCRQTEAPKLIHLVRGDLDWIVMKCLEKDRRRRYETANGLAMDLQRHLDSEPVVARPPSKLYLLGKLLRRNKTAFAGAAAVAAALIVGAVVSTWQAVRADWQREEAVKARADAEAQAKRAMKAEADARAVLRFFQEKVLSAARPEGQEGGLGRGATIQAAVDAAEMTIQESFADQPLVEASIREVLGITYMHLTDYTNAVRQFERVRVIREAQLEPEHADTLLCMNNLAAAYEAAGRPLEALPIFEETLRLRVARQGTNNADTFNSLANLAFGYESAGQPREALRLYEEAMRVADVVFPTNDPTRIRLVANVGALYRGAGRIPDAIRLYEQTLAMAKATIGPEHPDTLLLMNNLAIAFGVAGQWTNALPLLEKSLEISKSKRGLDHQETLTLMCNLGMIYAKADRAPEGIALLEDTVQRSQARAGPDHPMTLKYMNCLNSVYHSSGRRDEALRLGEQVLALSEGKLGRHHPDTLLVLANLATSYLEADRVAEAIPLFEEAYTNRAIVLGSNHPDTLHTMDKLARSYLKAARYSDAQLTLQQLVERRIEVNLETSQAAAETQALLAECLLRQTSFYDAEAQLRQAQPLLEQYSNTLTSVMNHDGLLGWCFFGQKRFGEAAPLLIQSYERTSQIEERPYSKATIQILSETANRLIQLNEALDKPEQAADWKRKLEELEAALSPPAP